MSLHLLYSYSCVHTSSYLYSVAMTQQEGWGGVLHQRIAAAIRNAREGRMSAQELADETARLSYPVSRSQIANYESGRKQSLDVADLLVLAAALNIPPGLLLFPGYPVGEVEFLPGRSADAKAALDWFSGDGQLPLEPGRERIVRIPNAGVELVRLVREYSRATALFVQLQALAKAKDAVADRSHRSPDWGQQMRDLEGHICELQDQIDAACYTFEIEEKPR